LGGSIRAGYYTDGGKPILAEGVDRTSPVSGQFVPDSAGRLDLMLIPLQILGTVQLTPFRGKWFVIDGWYGFERLHYREIRSVTSAAARTSLYQTGVKLMSNSTDQNESKTNRGYVNSLVTGASFNILLNPLDPTSARSMESTLGFRYVYIAPFVEMVKSLDATDGLSFGRTTTGISFNFESVL